MRMGASGATRSPASDHSARDRRTAGAEATPRLALRAVESGGGAYAGRMAVRAPATSSAAASPGERL